MERNHAGLLSSLVSLAGCCLAGLVQADPVDQAIEAELRRQNIPGLAVAVVERGAVSRLASYGFANLEHRVPVTSDTVFQAGSTAKQFVSLGILILASEGKLDVDDPLTKFLPGAPQHWGDIRLRHLMAHTSGLAEDPPDVDSQETLSPEALRQVFFRTPKQAPAGTRWSYSNSGYAMLGMVIESVTGQPYHLFLERRIFLPLGMTSTRAISESDIIPNRAAGYEREGEAATAPLRNQAWVSQSFNSTADGSTYITARDFAAFLAALDQPPASLEPHFGAMLRPAAQIGRDSAISYGYGWFITALDGRTVQYHSGSWQGFRVNMIRYPEAQASVVLLANSDIPERQALVETVLHTFLPGFPVPREW